MMDLSLSLAQKKIAAVYDLDKLLQKHDDYQKKLSQSSCNDSDGDSRTANINIRQIIVDYYKQSEIGYRKYHSQQGSIHMAINEGDRFDPSGYYTQPKLVAKEVETLQAEMVLEVGSGKGFNSRFLASHFPNVQFLGIDLTPVHVKLANQEAIAPNLNFRVGDFNQTELASNSVDLVFGVDCLCHAASVSTVLAELYRVLKPGGRLVMFDGYRRLGFEQQNAELQMASQLVELGMAVPTGFRSVETWLNTAGDLGFKTILCDDRTRGILPTLKRLQGLSYRFFKRTWRAKLIKLWAPPYLSRNAIAGLLMPFTCDIDRGTHRYYHIILEKPA